MNPGLTTGLTKENTRFGRNSADNSAVPGEAWSWRTTLVTCLIGALICLAAGFNITERGGDFTEFYSASKLAGTGQLYNWDRLRTVERRYGDIEIPFGRLPFYGVIFKPLAALPYMWARTAWLLLNAGALLVFGLLWPVQRRDQLATSLCWCFPAALLLSTGQDTAMFLVLVALGFRLLEADHDFAAGLVLSLCAAKFHLALGIPVFLLARRKWLAVLAGALGGLVQLAVSFAAEGQDWIANLFHLASISQFSPAVPKMPNLLGLTYWLPHGVVVEVLLGVAALAAVWVISSRSTPVAGATAAIIAGLLVGHHAYAYDAVLLLPALALAWQLPLPEVPRYWVLLLWTPIPCLLLMKDRFAALGQVSMSGFCLALLAVLAATSLGVRVFPDGSRKRVGPDESAKGPRVRAAIQDRNSRDHGGAAVVPFCTLRKTP